ncbi:MAG: T9SS C-terminal target domain-containing protein [Chitinophagia bacterium]|nr:T9SS C-terminal target domain-containing protein [Chitinophagia bacterium]
MPPFSTPLLLRKTLIMNQAIRLFTLLAVVLLLGGGLRAQTVTLSASAGDSICAGVADTFTATTSGFGAHAFRWYVNSRAVPRDTTNTFIPRRLNNGDSIWVVVTNLAGDTVLATSDTIIMTVIFPPRPLPITGPDSLCVGTFVSLMDSSIGGVWSVTNTALATVSATGVVYGLAPTPPRGAGVSVVYKLTGTCGSDSAVLRLRIDRPSSGIVGVSEICLDSITAFTDSARGGVWTTSDTNVASFIFRNILRANSSGMVTLYFTGSNTCGAFADSATLKVVNCDTTTAVPVVSSSEGMISVYPNPAASGSVITISAGSPAQCTITDVTGAVMVRRDISGNGTLHFTGAPGIYVVTLTTSKGRYNTRLVITE